MAKTKTSFVKGHKSIGGRPAGCRNLKTQAWEELGEYLIGEGAERYIEALKGLSDKVFIDKYVYLIEFFKPKLSRSEIKELDQTSEKITTVYVALQRESATPEPKPE